MENVNVPEVAATAANNQKTLLETALSNDRKVQCAIFGRHFSSTQKVEVVKKGAKDFLESIDKWKSKLQELLLEIEQYEAEGRMKSVLAGADNLSADELQQMIAALTAKAAEKVA